MDPIEFYLLDEDTSVAVRWDGRWRNGRIVDEPKQQPKGGREIELESGERITVSTRKIIEDDIDSTEV
ncbi:MAG: hypothetical protein ABEN55_21205 [Bradymonadaceae bacterium]